MKRVLSSLIVAGAVALMAAGTASAAIPGLCGHSYALLMSGGNPQTVSSTGGMGLPGAATSAMGVGTITFAAAEAGATSCAVTSGELIYNAGDIQTNPVGLYFGPAVCYGSASALGTGLPCFDGQNNIGSGLLSGGGPGASYVLSFNANYNWFDGVDTAGTVAFSFWIQNTLGSTVAVGASMPGTVDPSLPGNGAPVLSITLEKQTIVPVATAYGVAPYKGQAAISCLGQGANSSDPVASSQAAAANGIGATVTGGFESAVATMAIFPPPATGPACQAAGVVSINANDNYVISGTPPSNNNCAFTFLPGDCIEGYTATQTSPAFSTAASQFADGASNGSAFIATTSSNCAQARTAGAGYAISAVQWGGGDADSYLMATGQVSDATGYEPAGGSSVCTEYQQLPTVGKITNLVQTTIVQSVSRFNLGPKAGYVKVTNPTSADCDLDIEMPEEDSRSCILYLSEVALGPESNPVATDLAGPTPSTLVATTNCLCSLPPQMPDQVTSTLRLSSAQCPLSGTTSYTITCENTL